MRIRHFGRGLEGVIQPVPEVTIGKQVQTEQGDEATKGQITFGAELQILEQQAITLEDVATLIGLVRVLQK